ncbi:hypothetical protein Rumeso_01370 [Rubellimicrobium mesophilum DSM 19309]|uniref:Uncharacterized protein n=1 Tax=Rubellimicrobium mesophilum DSM 19309 TaxID=442562 RepID=A0A017HRW4_9RHOB|nr:hypothetical protein [Rubellimicrobium mesophilum]EYD77111.1 hypothetical protein Rumeso_01370 [Rubellimicrobium mesophilum DSM 19309]
MGEYRDVDGTMTLITWDQVIREMEVEAAFQRTLKPRDPRHKSMVEVDRELGYVSVFWGGYSYDIAIERITSPDDLLWWIVHLAEKGWEHTTPERIALLIAIVVDVKGWPAWGHSGTR